MTKDPKSCRMGNVISPLSRVVRVSGAWGSRPDSRGRRNGQRKFLPIDLNCAVVLAMSAVESTRIALLSFPTPLMGRNLMVHLRTNLTVRIRRSALASGLPAQLETGAVLVRGSTGKGTLSSQFTASASPSAPGSSVTDENGLFHYVRNAYVADRRVISDRGPSESSPRWPDTGRPQGGGGDRVERRTCRPAWGSNP